MLLNAYLCKIHVYQPVYVIVLSVGYKSRPRTCYAESVLHRKVCGATVRCGWCFLRLQLCDPGLLDFIQSIKKEGDSRCKQVEGEFDYAERQNVVSENSGSSIMAPSSKPLALCGVLLASWDYSLNKGLQNQAHGFFPFPDPHANTSWSSSTSQSSLVALDHVPGKYRGKKLIVPMLLGSAFRLSFCTGLTNSGNSGPRLLLYLFYFIF